MAIRTLSWPNSAREISPNIFVTGIDHPRIHTNRLSFLREMFVARKRGQIGRTLSDLGHAHVGWREHGRTVKFIGASLGAARSAKKSPRTRDRVRTSRSRQRRRGPQ